MSSSETQTLPRPSRRLLEALAEEGASARESEMRPGFLAVSAPKKGVTKILASLPKDAAVWLVEHTLAAWRGDSLVITHEGGAHLRRLKASGHEDPFQAQHRDTRTESRSPGERVTVDATESPLAWLARRRDKDGKPLIASHEFEAGERFRRDITVAQWLPSVTTNWSQHGASVQSDPGRTLLPSEVALAARQRLGKALAALGPEFSGLVLDACAFLKKLETIEAERGWPPRSGKVVLRMGLSRFARHYGLSAEGKGPSRGKPRHWGADDYRPFISSGAEPD